MLVPGQMIGNYRVEKPLGEGGMGTVYTAVHQYIGRGAAIKVLHKELSQNPNFVSRFLNEARIVNLVRHPGLVEIFEFGLLPDGTAYIIMELVAGESIRERQRRSGGRLPAEAPQLGRHIALALAAAHEKEIVHRDLKPDNVMIVPDPDRQGGDHIKILDFGVAKIATAELPIVGQVQKTQTGLALGTPAYMAPEQCTGEGAIDGKADVYALGVMLYEMISGKVPFESPLSAEIMIMHIKRNPRRIREMVPGVPEEMAGLVHEMLAKSPALRPTMKQVAERLLHLGPRMSGPLPVVVPTFRPGIDPLSLTSVTRPGIRRRPRKFPAVASMLVVVMAALALGVSWKARHRARPVPTAVPVQAAPEPHLEAAPPPREAPDEPEESARPEGMGFPAPAAPPDLAAAGNVPSPDLSAPPPDAPGPQDLLPAERENVVHYLGEMDRIMTLSRNWMNDPDSLTRAVLQPGASGRAGGPDDLLRTSEQALAAMKALDPPEPCQEHHQAALAMARAGTDMLRVARSDALRQDPGAILRFGRQGEALRGMARRVEVLGAELKRRYAGAEPTR